MKKSLLALAVLASAAGAANAASSVTMYGRMDVGYESAHHDGKSVTQDNGVANTNMSRFGIKGQEDLGNGLAATFKLEGHFNGDTGSYAKDMFDRESTVGLKGNFGSVRFGRATAALENGLGDFVIGERALGFSNYASATRHSNSAFYDYSMGGLTAGANVSTKGGDSGNTDAAGNVIEGNGKIGYGLYAKYSANNFGLGAAYQRDGVALTKEWGVAASYTFNPVTLGASYADQKADGTSTHTKTINAFVSGAVTANDTVYAQYNRVKVTNASATTAYGLGYNHALSKRTSVYGEVARNKRTSSTGELVSGYDYSVAMRHAF